MFRLSDFVALESKYPTGVSRIDDKKPEKKLRLNQIHKIKCREVAEKLWKEDSNITIADMVQKDEIHALLDGRSYVDKTIGNWINDLCPDRSPGRRPKKK